MQFTQVFPAIVAVLATSIGWSGQAAAQELLLYGGRGHDVFLGCLNCGQYDSSSICNEYGAGSAYSTDSIFNAYGKFGSRYSSDSPWNAYSTSNSVPVVVDRQGNFYGYFTVNQFRSDAVSYAADLNAIFDMAEGNLKVVQNFICSN